jgi:hypothetical protein
MSSSRAMANGGSHAGSDAPGDARVRRAATAFSAAAIIF